MEAAVHLLVCSDLVSMVDFSGASARGDGLRPLILPISRSSLRWCHRLLPLMAMPLLQEGVLTSLDLSRAIFSRIRLNYVWAMGYNVLMIPVAAGAFFPLTHVQVGCGLCGTEAKGRCLGHSLLLVLLRAAGALRPPRLLACVTFRAWWWSVEEAHASCSGKAGAAKLMRHVLLPLLAPHPPFAAGPLGCGCVHGLQQHECHLQQPAPPAVPAAQACAARPAGHQELMSHFLVSGGALDS